MKDIFNRNGMILIYSMLIINILLLIFWENVSEGYFDIMVNGHDKGAVIMYGVYNPLAHFILAAVTIITAFVALACQYLIIEARLKKGKQNQNKLSS
jgi:hypothetical protein